MKRILILTLAFAGIASIMPSCNQSKKKEMVQQEIYGNHQGKEVYMFTLTKAGEYCQDHQFGGKIN